jgi:hypothetical protein
MAPDTLCHSVSPSASAGIGAIMLGHFNQRSKTDGSEAKEAQYWFAV